MHHDSSAVATGCADTFPRDAELFEKEGQELRRAIGEDRMPIKELLDAADALEPENVLEPVFIFKTRRRLFAAATTSAAASSGEQDAGFATARVRFADLTNNQLRVIGTVEGDPTQLLLCHDIDSEEFHYAFCSALEALWNAEAATTAALTSSSAQQRPVVVTMAFYAPHVPILQKLIHDTISFIPVKSHKIGTTLPLAKAQLDPSFHRISHGMKLSKFPQQQQRHACNSNNTLSNSSSTDQSYQKFLQRRAKNSSSNAIGNANGNNGVSSYRRERRQRPPTPPSKKDAQRHSNSNVGHHRHSRSRSRSGSRERRRASNAHVSAESIAKQQQQQAAAAAPAFSRPFVNPAAAATAVAAAAAAAAVQQQTQQHTATATAASGVAAAAAASSISAGQQRQQQHVSASSFDLTNADMVLMLAEQSATPRRSNPAEQLYDAICNSFTNQATLPPGFSVRPSRPPTLDRESMRDNGMIVHDHVTRRAYKMDSPGCHERLAAQLRIAWFKLNNTVRSAIISVNDQVAEADRQRKLEEEAEAAAALQGGEESNDHHHHHHHHHRNGNSTPTNGSGIIESANATSIGSSSRFDARRGSRSRSHRRDTGLSARTSRADDKHHSSGGHNKFQQSGRR